MFVAHIPAGYMMSKQILAQFQLNTSKTKLLMALGLIGSVFPDLDMFYFYLIDHRQHNHHSYWTHIPIYWIALLSIAYTIAAVLKSHTFVAAVTVFVGSALCHLLLDSFAGGIQWLYPFSNEYFRMISIPPRYDYWLWNYLLHWTALVEFVFIVSAVWMYRHTRRKK